LADAASFATWSTLADKASKSFCDTEEHPVAIITTRAATPAFIASFTFITSPQILVLKNAAITASE
jgi:hypothetical protein